MIALVALALALPTSSRAADIGQTASPTAHALEAGDLEAFFDGLIPLQLERGDVAGASVLVMHGD